jgi:four helix bundle protein
MLQTLPAVRRVIDRIRSYDRNLADQLRRSATSIALNLAEADGNQAGHRRNRLHTAMGSLRETRTALQIGVAFGYVNKEVVDGIDRDLDQVAAMTWRRLHPRG